MSDFENLVDQVTLLIAESNLFEDHVAVTGNKPVKRTKVKAGAVAPINIETTSDEKPTRKTRKPRKKKEESAKVGKSVCDVQNNFWVAHGDQAFDVVRRASGPFKGNYAKLREFLSEDWVDRETFTKKDLVDALTKKYPEDSGYNSESKFKIQGAAWVYGVKREKTGEWHVLPLLKKTGRGVFRNPFFG